MTDWHVVSRLRASVSSEMGLVTPSRVPLEAVGVWNWEHECSLSISSPPVLQPPLYKPVRPAAHSANSCYFLGWRDWL